MTQHLDHWATWREITAQPDIWRDWAGQLDIAALRNWVADLDAPQVWFCGAGTSAYIGDILAAGLEGQGAFRSVPTTDIVSRPAAFLQGRAPLVVQFGRSGDSAETVGLLDALDALAPLAPRLNITCNASGALALRKGQGAGRTVVLPATAHDAGFAMTASFSTMLLTAAAIFAPQGATAPFAALADALAAALPTYRDIAAQAALPERIVFLGTGPLAFAAREGALKVMELAAGQIPALWESTLGFRHGPKSFVTPGTHIVLFASQDAHAARYEADLVAELGVQFPDCPVTVIDADPMLGSDLWAVPVCVAFAQVLAVVWSDRMGLPVDDPFAGQGTLTRVVSGVTLYPVAP